MREIFVLLGFLFSIITHAQTTFYVDATNGSDANSGQVITAAWKTIDKVNQQSFVSGDSILFRKGEIWSGKRLYIESISATQNNNVVFGAYGIGAKPIISSVVPQSHNWVSASGNIWKATDPPTDNPERMLINGIERLRANIYNELDGNTYYWLFDTIGDLYIYSVANPNSFLIEYSTDFPLIVGAANHVTIRDIDIQGGWTGIYINTESKNINLYNLEIGRYCREGVVISSGSSNATEYPQNIVIQNCLFDSHFEFDYSASGTYPESSDRGSSDGYRANVLNVGVLQNCIFKNWGHASISLGGVNVSNISIHDNYLSSPDICYGGRMAVEDGAYNNELFNNQIINTSVQSQLGGQNNHYHHNIFSGTKDTPLKPTIVDAGVEMQAYDNTDIVGNIFENNIFLDIEGPAFRISGNNESNIHNNVFRNNIIYNCGALSNHEGIVVEANLFKLTTDNSFQNNLIFNLSTTQTCNFRGSVTDVAGFALLSGTDGYIMSDNISVDPLFVNANIANYHLQAGSHCIDAGISALSNVDFEGNIMPYYGTNYDIGIYEYQPESIIENLYSEESIDVYPNPAADYLIISGDLSKVKKIQIINSTGQIILQDISVNNKIDLSSLSNGIYFIKVELANKSITNRFVIIN